MIETSRRSFLLGASSLLAAPAIVRVASLMPVKAIADETVLARALFTSPLILPQPIDMTATEVLLRLQEYRLKMDRLWQEAAEAMFPSLDEMLEVVRA